MKNGGRALLLVCAFAFALLLGLFIGRNLQSGYVMLPTNADTVVDIKSGELDYRLDINQATKAQLMELPGIGNELAERIIDYRSENGSFAATDDLLNVEGIGQKKLLQIEQLIKAGG